MRSGLGPACIMPATCHSCRPRQTTKSTPALPCADVKEAARLCFASALEAGVGKPHDPKSDMRIALSISHPDAAGESSWLATTNSSAGRQRRGWGRHGKQQRQQPKQQQQQQQGEQELPALTDAVVQRLAGMLQAEFAAGCPQAAAQLAVPAAPATVQLQGRRQPVHIGGRYLKLRRGIPQSPWFIDGARKGEGSVTVGGPHVAGLSCVCLMGLTGDCLLRAELSSNLP